MKDKLEHNQWIAAALNFKPVSKVFIIVKADMRMANVCDGIRKYSDRFIELEPDAIGVLVTFMDTVDWSKQQMKEAIEEELGFKDVVFSGKNYSASSLLNDIKELSKKKYDLMADAENFFRLQGLEEQLRASEEAVRGSGPDRPRVRVPGLHGTGDH